MRRARRGAAAAELGLVLPVVITWLVGTVELGRLLQLKQVAAAAAQDGARAAGRTEGPAGDPSATLVSLAEASARAALDSAGRPCGTGCVTQATVVDDGAIRWIEVEITLPWSPSFASDWAPASVGARASAPLRRQQ